MYKTLGKKFNGVAQATKLFLVGFKDFAKDARIYATVRAKVLLNSECLRKLSLKELDIYYRWPSEFSRLFPTIAISALPFANYVMIPIAYYYPKHLLSSHFWTSEQKNIFQLDALRRKHRYYGPAMEFLQAHVCFITEDVQREAFERLLRKVESRIPVSPEEILLVRDSFTFKPFCLTAINPKHVNTLCRMHGMGPSIFRTKTRLWKTAQMIQYLDFAIQREGTADMAIDDLRTACFVRGYNSTNKSGDDMNEFIRQWVAVTTTLTPRAYSLILHLSIFLCYDSNDWKPKI